jgi:predicted dehydrogenase
MERRATAQTQPATGAGCDAGPMSQQLRVGLIGGGPWAREVHAPAIAEHRDFELAGVWTRRPEVAAELAAAHGSTAYDSIGSLVDAVDVVALAVPPAVQAEAAVAAARAGRHVILEKPLAESADAARAVADAVDAAGVASITVLTFRFAPETRRWLDEVAAGVAWSGGSARLLSGGLRGGPYAGSAWRQRHGAILDIGPHAFDLLDAALGPIVGVRAASASEPDLWHTIVEHRSGAVSTATVSMRLAIDPSVNEFEVYGSGGRLTLAPRRTRPRRCFATLLDEVAAMIRSGTTTHPCDVHRGVHLQRIIDEVRRLGDA